MPLNLEQKQAIVANLSETVTQAVSAIAADYRGLTVSELTELRLKARDSGVKMGVYRNTLVRRAVSNTDFACLDDALKGPIVLFFAMEEPGVAARLVRDFIKDNEKLEVKALVMDGQLLAADQLKAVASLPSREEALAQLLSVMIAPVTKFVRTLNEPVAQTVRAFGAVSESKKEA